MWLAFVIIVATVLLLTAAGLPLPGA
jgi:hypothetical protein